MVTNDILTDSKRFSEALYEKMKLINPGISKLEPYEFRYGLNNLEPEEGDWSKIVPEDPSGMEQWLNELSFYESIQIKPKSGDRIVLDPAIISLTNMIFVGLVTCEYSVEWTNRNFYFDIRGFYFLHRTQYFTGGVMNRIGPRPYRQYEKKQVNLMLQQDIGYQEFKEANADVDHAFIETVKKLIGSRGTPVVIAIAGPTAAGKTEIVDRLHADFRSSGYKTTSIELDNFLTDRDYREEKGIHTQGKGALHLGLLESSLHDICRGKRISIPRYDFIYATSSHDINGNLKPEGVPIEIEPAEIIFIEGNFPFLIEEVAHLIGIKVVYLTDDPVRLKRKWKRDIDYRKKYEPTYFRNRFFKDQFIMAQIAYIPQMEICDMVVDTTGAALWLSEETQESLTKC